MSERAPTPGEPRAVELYNGPAAPREPRDEFGELYKEKFPCGGGGGMLLS